MADNTEPSVEQLRERILALEQELALVQSRRLDDVISLEARLRRMDKERLTDSIAARQAERMRLYLREVYGSWAYRIGRRLKLAPEPYSENGS